MSTVDADVETPGAPLRESDPPGGHTELTSARLARVGDVEVRRLLPLRRRRSVGAWCFVDHYGPMSVDGVAGMQVPPHPHIGLQTVTWLFDGEALHRDSLGSAQPIRPSTKPPRTTRAARSCACAVRRRPSSWKETRARARSSPRRSPTRRSASTRAPRPVSPAT